MPTSSTLPSSPGPRTIPSHPILSLDQVRAWEAALFAGDEQREWAAMQRAGAAVAEGIRRDYGELGAFPPAARILVLAGKGHNAGDALIAARVLLQMYPGSRAEVVFAFGEGGLGALAARAWRELVEAGRERVESKGPSPAGMVGRYDVSIDGIFGFQFRPPLAEAAAKILGAANELTVGLRAAVDLPSGLNEPGAFRADFTYATGSLKAPVMACAAAGRLRYLDLGFFAGMEGGAERVLLPSVLAPLGGLRRADSDKRSQGHLLVVAGSRGYPGAALMAVLAALKSGVGLVTAFVAESLVPAFAAQAPEAMWVGWPESAGGGLALGGIELLKAKLRGATALAIGPGLGREPETMKVAAEIVRMMEIPVLIDADALQPEIVRSGKVAHVLTPHAGEFKRISEGLDPRALAKAAHGVVVLKGPVTKITDGGDVYHSLAGGPVLSRGGSGDLLAGLTGGLLAQTPADPLLAAARGVAWHGRAADKLAEACGQTSVRTSQLLDFLGPALRE